MFNKLAITLAFLVITNVATNPLQANYHLYDRNRLHIDFDKKNKAKAASKQPSEQSYYADSSEPEEDDRSQSTACSN